MPDKNKENIYKGDKFTVMWAENAKGKCQARDYYNASTLKEQEKALALFMLMGDFGVIRNIKKFRAEGEGIFVFKSDADRYFSAFVKGKKIIITNAYQKKSKKMPRAQFNRAVKARELWLENHG